MLGYHLPLPTPVCHGVAPAVAVCQVCWAAHNEPLLNTGGLAVGWSCAGADDRERFRAYLAAAEQHVLAANCASAETKEWLASPPEDLTPEEAAAILLWRMGVIPQAAATYLRDFRPRPAPLGSPGERVSCSITCVRMEELPRTEWGRSFLIEFASAGHRLLWRTGTGGFDPRPGQTYNVRLTIKSHERYGGTPVTYIQRIKENDSAASSTSGPADVCE